MDERATAEIIPFPMREVAAAPAPTLSPAASDPERLGAAFSSLATAMAEQREAVQKWRDAVKQLSTHMQTLSETLDASKLKFAKKN